MILSMTSMLVLLSLVLAGVSKARLWDERLELEELGHIFPQGDQGRDVSRVIKQMRDGLGDLEEEMMMPDWFPGFGDKEVHQPGRDRQRGSAKPSSVGTNTRVKSENSGRVAQTKRFPRGKTRNNGGISANNDGAAATAPPVAGQSIRRIQPAVRPPPPHSTRQSAASQAVTQEQRRKEILLKPAVSSHLDKLAPPTRNDFSAGFTALSLQNGPHFSDGTKHTSYINKVCRTTESPDILSLCKSLNPNQIQKTKMTPTTTEPKIKSTNYLKRKNTIKLSSKESQRRKLKQLRLSRLQEAYTLASQSVARSREPFSHLFFHSGSFRRRKAFPSLLDSLRESVRGFLSSPLPRRGGRRALLPLQLPPTSFQPAPAPLAPGNGVRGEQ